MIDLVVAAGMFIKTFLASPVGGMIGFGSSWAAATAGIKKLWTKRPTSTASGPVPASVEFHRQQRDKCVQRLSWLQIAIFAMGVVAVLYVSLINPVKDPKCAAAKLDLLQAIGYCVLALSSVGVLSIAAIFSRYPDNSASS